MEEIAGYLKYISDERLEDVFESHTIRLTQPKALNDPLEFNPVLKGYVPAQYSPYLIDGIIMPSDEAWDREHLLERRINEKGVLSLTKNATSFDMWSRYANGHKGFLIELTPEFDKHRAFLTNAGSCPGVKKVDYIDQCEVDLKSVMDVNGFVPFDDFDAEVFFKKTKLWENEKEYRLVRKLDDLRKAAEKDKDGIDIYTCTLPIEIIVSVVFGACMNPEDKKCVVKNCKGTKINFFQSYIYRDQPNTEVHLLPLKDGSLEQTLKGKSRRLTLEHDHVADILNNKHVVKHISEIGYYKNNSQLVEELFLRAKNRRNIRVDY